MIQPIFITNKKNKMEIELMKAVLLKSGWSLYYNDNYWVHPKVVADKATQDHTNYGMTLENAYEFEVNNKPPLPMARPMSLAQQSLSQSDWISVKDRLPDNEWWVLVRINGKTQILPHYCAKMDDEDNILDDRMWCEYGSPKTPIGITHWMNYPE